MQAFIMSDTQSYELLAQAFAYYYYSEGSFGTEKRQALVIKSSENHS